MVQNIEIFIINLARSKDRYESMKRKIAKIRGFSVIYIDGVEITHQLAKDKSQSLPLPCGGGLRGWVDSRKNSGAKFSNSDFTHPLAPSAREGEQNANRSAREGESESSLRGRIADSHEAIQKNQMDCHDFANPKSRNDDIFLVSTQSTEFALHFHFFPAIDANDFKINSANIPTHYHPKLTRFVKGKDLSFGEIACFSSHYRLWEKCVALDSPIVVLEDDIDFMQDFCQIVEIIKSPFDYVRLYYLFNRKMSQICNNFYISFDKIAGTQGYYLTPKAAKKFIKNARFWLFCVDDYMDMFFIHSVKNIIFLPFIITEDSANATQSTISGREKPKMRFYQKLTRELSRIYFFVIRKALYFALNCIEIRANFWAKQNRR